MNFILQNENAIYYEAGFSCDNVLYLNLKDEKYFITDGRYTTEAKENLNSGIEVITSKDLIKELKKLLKNKNIKKLTIDPYDFSLASFEKLSSNIDIKFIKKPNFSKQKRIIKSDQEIKYIKKAMDLGRDGFDQFALYLQKNAIGKTEQFLHHKAKDFISHMGKYELSFDPIVALNQNSAKPHALPTKLKLSKNDLLLVDAGIKYKRYCSDRTCTSKVHKDMDFERSQWFSKQEQQRVYDVVLKAQQKAIEKARIGMKAKDIDRIARDVIEKAGYGKYFIHSTGHGVGLDIHEFPVISQKSKTIIEDNMVFTIEPGIYLAQKFGVRIEDTVVMKNGKAQIL
jgi:Xaa-Pro aminopeptidase